MHDGKERGMEPSEGDLRETTAMAHVIVLAGSDGEPYKVADDPQRGGYVLLSDYGVEVVEPFGPIGRRGTLYPWHRVMSVLTSRQVIVEQWDGADCEWYPAEPGDALAYLKERGR